MNNKLLLLLITAIVNSGVISAMQNVERAAAGEISQAQRRKATDTLIKLARGMKHFNATPDAIAARLTALIAEGADIDNFEEGFGTVLVFAVTEGDINFAKVLISKGANPFIPDDENLTPRQIAERRVSELQDSIKQFEKEIDFQKHPKYKELQAALKEWQEIIQLLKKAEDERKPEAPISPNPLPLMELQNAAAAGTASLRPHGPSTELRTGTAGSGKEV